MNDADTQGIGEGREEAKEQEKKKKTPFIFKFSLICISSVSVKMV